MIGDFPGDWVGDLPGDLYGDWCRDWVGVWVSVWVGDLGCDLGCEELGRGVARCKRGIIFGSGTQGDALGCRILPRWGGDMIHDPRSMIHDP